MKHLITIHTRAILLMALMLLMPSAMWADKEAYAEYADGTLTFHYDENRASYTNTYAMPAAGVSPGWLSRQGFIKKVVFSEDFKDARPERCAKWFYQMSSLTEITGLEYLNTSKVNDMSYMFGSCTQLTSLDLSHFSTDGVTTMTHMFYECKSLTALDVTTFNTRKVDDMSYMFGYCSKLTELDLSPFCTQKVTNMNGMFTMDNALTHIDVIDFFVTDSVSSSKDMFMGCVNLPGFDKNSTDKTKASEYLTYLPAQPWVEFQLDTHTLTFYNNNTKLAVEATAKYDLPATGDPGWLNVRSSILKVVFDESFKDARPTRCAKWFNNLNQLTDIQGLEYLCTDSVNDMSNMFSYSWALSSLDLSHFNTEKVTTMRSMFEECEALSSLDISSFNTQKVDDMTRMFYYCARLTSLDLSSFNTEKVTSMENMFTQCCGLATLDFSSFSTQNVNNMSHMFSNCIALTSLDLHTFDTRNVTNMAGMFGFDSGLTSIKVSSLFTVDQVENSSGMFYDCTSLPGFNKDYTDKTKAPQYLTYMPNQLWVEFQEDTQTLTFHNDVLKDDTKATAKFDMPASGEEPKWLWLPNGYDVTKVVFKESFKDVRPKSCTKWFYGLTDVTDITGLEYLCTDSVNDMSYMFYNCENLTSLDLSHFCTDSVTTMAYMFYGCSTLPSLDVSSFNTQKVTNMADMFYNCKNLTELDLTSFNTQNVTNMADMFSNCENLTELNIASFDTRNVTNMQCMFAYDEALQHIYVSDLFATDKVMLSNRMFIQCKNLPNFDSSSTDHTMAPTYLTYLPDQLWAEYQDATHTLTFRYDNIKSAVPATSKYDFPVAGEDPSWLERSGYIMNVVFSESFKDAHPKSCHRWFYNMTDLTDIQGMDYLHTDSVTDMSEMFSYCEHIATLDLTPFDTQNVTDMSGMFYRCMDLNVIYVSEPFVTEQVTSSDRMFWGCISIPSFDANYIDKTKAPEYLTYLHLQPWVEYQDSTLTFHYDARKDITTADGKYDLPAANEDPAWSDHYSDVTKAVFCENFKNARPKRLTKWFNGKFNLADIQGIEYLCTDSVNDMSEMFRECFSLTSIDLSHFNTENVTTMRGMFRGCSSLKTLDVSSFNTQKVDNMSTMFALCSQLTELDLSHFNTENVTDMYSMLCECPLLTKVDISSFNTKNVTDMYHMFGESSSLTKLDLSHFDTRKVTNMRMMFYKCTNLAEVNLSGFNTEEANSMAGMFYGCNNLTKLDLSTFDTKKVTDMRMMFYDCNNLPELDLSTFDTQKVTDMYCMFGMKESGAKLQRIYVSEQFVTDSVTDDQYMFENSTMLPNFDSNSIGKDKAHYKETEGGYLTLRRKITVGEDRYNVDGYDSPTCYTDVTFTDGKAYSAPCDFTFSSDNTASYIRTVSNHWATLCLPFAFSADNNSTARFYSVGSYADGNIAVTARTGEIAAGTPVLAYVSDGELCVTATGAAAVAEAKQLSELKGAFTQTEVTDDEYIIANDHFWNAAWLKENNEAVKNVYVAPYRASLTLPSTEAKPNSISISENKTDGIDSINAEVTDPSAELYDLQGRRLTAPQRGMIIVRKGGVSRKVVVR